MILRILTLLSLFVGSIAIATGAATADPSNGGSCTTGAAGGGFNGQTGIWIGKSCVSLNDSVSGAVGPPTRVVSCGVLSSNGIKWLVDLCGIRQTACQTPPDAQGRTFPAAAFATQTLVGGQWVTKTLWCPGQDARILTLADIRQAVIKLIPTTSIGLAPTGSTLVNIQTVTWAGTAPSRDLGVVTVVGTQVHLRLAFATATWKYGDGQSDVRTTPGRPYDKSAAPCTTRMCPGYQGHVYTTKGSMTVTMTVAWHASYSLDGANWIDVDPAPLPGPTATAAIVVHEARAVLVPHK